MKANWWWPVPFTAVAMVALGCAALTATRVIDPDVFWHVRTGEWIVDHGALPATDPFLQTQGDTPWVLHEWLFQLLMVTPYRAWGLEGLRILGVVTIVIIYLSLYHAGRRRLGHFGATVAAVTISATVLPALVARPQLASYLLFVPFLASVIHHYDTGRLRSLVWIPFAMVAWVNFHGGYMIALGVLLVATVAAAIDWTLVPRACGATADRSPLPLAACLLASVLAAGVNPYGLGHLLYPFQTMSISLLPQIQEWQPPDWNSINSRVLLLMALAFILFQQYRRQPTPVFDWAVVLSLLFLALQSRRHAPFASLAAGMLIMMRWHLRPAWLDSPAGVLLHIQRLLGLPCKNDPRRQQQDIGAATESWLNVGLILTVLALTLLLLGSAQERQFRAFSPNCGIDAVEYVRHNGIAGPGLNSYGFGGYMTYALWPEQKAFIDGRSDMYSNSFAEEYMTMTRGAPGWREIFDRYDFNYVVMPKQVPLVQLLIASGSFVHVYEDATNTVMIRQAGAPGGTPDGEKDRIR